MTMSTKPSGPVSSTGTRLQVISSTGLRVEATTSAIDGILDIFYADYDLSFILANEKETYKGFSECLMLNHGDAYRRLAHLFGPFREFVAVVYDGKTRIAGLNFIILPLSSSRSTVYSANLNYIFVNPAVRRRGYFSRLMGDLAGVSIRLFAHTNPNDLPCSRTENANSLAAAPPVYIYLEQNDPLRLAAAESDRDTKLTGLDQFDRITIWARLGAKIIDFPYVQPPLSREQGPDDTLVYAVLGTEGRALQPGLLRGHLERFFGISVLKGKGVMQEAVARVQLEELERMQHVGLAVHLFDVPPDLKELAGTLTADLLEPKSVKDVLRRSAKN